MAQRFLAVLAAVAMVAGAFAYRSSRDGGDDGRAIDPTVAGAVVCAQELGPVCEAVRSDFPNLTIEPAADTFDRIVGARSPAAARVTVWVAAGPWADMVDAARPGKPELFGEPARIAATRLVVVNRRGTEVAACGTRPSWRCLGDAAQAPAFRLAGDPPSEAGHLFIRAAALGGFLESTDYSSNDLDEVPEAAGWLANVDGSLDRAAGFGAGSLAGYLATRGATAEVFVTTEAAVRSLRELPDFAVVAPTPPAILTASVATAVEARNPLDTEAIVAALERAGWESRVPPGEDGLPSPGVLVALREETG